MTADDLTLMDRQQSSDIDTTKSSDRPGYNSHRSRDRFEKIRGREYRRVKSITKSQGLSLDVFLTKPSLSRQYLSSMVCGGGIVSNPLRPD